MATKPKLRPLKIGFVFDDSLDQPDGVQQYVLGLGKWLANEGDDVHYLVGQTKRTDIPNVHTLSRNISVRFNRNRLSIPLPTSRKMLRAFLQDQKFDVLHVQMPHSPWLAHRVILAADDNTAILGTFHIVAYSRAVELGTKVLALWTRKSVSRIDKIFSVSSAAEIYAKNTYGIKTTVLPNIFDYSKYHNAARRSEYDEGTATILFLGRLVPRKGCLILLKAVALLPYDLTFRVVICGKGPLLANLKKFVEQNALSSRVEFAGFLAEDDKPSYYASADIAVFPSTGGESFGIVLVEAMASGKAAVLAGDNSGYHSVMSPRPELLFDPHDIVELAQKLEYFLRNKTARVAAQTWGKDYSKQFDVAIVGKRLLDHYDQVLRLRDSR